MLEKQRDASRLEAVALRLEAIVTSYYRLEAIATGHPY